MPTCLFFCADNALASLLAESYFNGQAVRGWRSTSAGLAPAPAADPRAASFLESLGYAAPDHAPRPVEKDLVSFMRVVVQIAVPEGTALPDWLASKVDRKIDLDDPRARSDEELKEWMALLSEKMVPVMALCRERTPRPFG